MEREDRVLGTMGNGVSKKKIGVLFISHESKVRNPLDEKHTITAMKIKP